MSKIDSTRKLTTFVQNTLVTKDARCKIKSNQNPMQGDSVGPMNEYAIN